MGEERSASVGYCTLAETTLQQWLGGIERASLPITEGTVLTVKHRSGSVRIQGCISEKCVGEMTFIDEFVYTHILNKMSPSVEKLGRKFPT